MEVLDLRHAGVPLPEELVSALAHRRLTYRGRSADSTSAPVRAASSTRPCWVMLGEDERQLDPGGPAAGGHEVRLVRSRSARSPAEQAPQLA